MQLQGFVCLRVLIAIGSRQWSGNVMPVPSSNVWRNGSFSSRQGIQSPQSNYWSDWYDLKYDPAKHRLRTWWGRDVFVIDNPHQVVAQQRWFYTCHYSVLVEMLDMACIDQALAGPTCENDLQSRPIHSCARPSCVNPLARIHFVPPLHCRCASLTQIHAWTSGVPCCELT